MQLSEIAQGVTAAHAIMEAWNSDSNGEERISPMLELKNFRVSDYKNHSQLKKLVQDESSSLHVLPSEALSTFKMDKQIVTVLTKLQTNLWKTIVIEGMVCKIEETKMATLTQILR